MSEAFIPPEPVKLPGDPVGAGWCYSCNKVRGQRIVTVCRKHYCLRCTKRHIDSCDDCSQQWYVDSKGEVQEIRQPVEEHRTEPEVKPTTIVEAPPPLERPLSAAERLAASRATRAVVAATVTDPKNGLVG